MTDSPTPHPIAAHVAVLLILLAGQVMMSWSKAHAHHEPAVVLADSSAPR